MRIVLVAAVALIDKDGRVLLSQRPLDKQLGGNINKKLGIEALLPCYLI